MKYHFLFALVNLIGFSCYAQPLTSPYIGKWVFFELMGHDKSNVNTINMLKSVFSEYTLYFGKDGRFFEKMKETDRKYGSWQYDNKSEKIIIIYENGNSINIDIKINQDILYFYFKPKEGICLKRDSLVREDTTGIARPEQQLVPVTPEELCKKWYLKERYVPGRDSATSATAVSMVQGTFFDFKSNGSYQAKILILEQSGTWELINDNRTLLLTADGEQKRWNVKSVNSTTLVLYRGKSEEYWTFSLEE